MKDIHFVVPTGRFIRNIHRWAAHLMVVAVLLHMARVFYTASYKAPREFNWVVGMVLFVLTLALSFTGYLLPWDQLAYWAITIGANIAASPRELTDALGITAFFDLGGLQKRAAARRQRGRAGGADPLLRAARHGAAARAGARLAACTSGASARTAASAGPAVRRTAAGKGATVAAARTVARAAAAQDLRPDVRGARPHRRRRTATRSTPCRAGRTCCAPSCSSSGD